MAPSRKKTAQGLQLDEIFLEGAQDRAGFWSDEASRNRPVAARRDMRDFDAVGPRPANDDGRAPRERRSRQGFAGSGQFWAAVTASIGFGLLFVVLMGLGTGGKPGALFASPAQHPAFWASLAVIAAVPWLFALQAHRQAVNGRMLEQVLREARRFHEPSVLADDAGHRVNVAFEHVFADIDARMALLDEKSALLASRVSATLLQSTREADMTIASMRSVAESGEAQREALQRTGMMISTEIMPVIAKLETTVAALETMSEGAGALLDGVSGRLQQSTQQLKACLDAFNGANHNVLPEIDKRMMKFEASVARLPEQIDATIGRLSPMSETIADAALLSTANIEVIDQLAKDITAALDSGRGSFAELAAASADLMQQAVDAQAGRFREAIEAVLTEQAARASGLSRELGQLADAASTAVDRLQQPVSEMAGATERALANADEAIAALDRRIEASLEGCVAELNDTASRLASQVSREIEAATLSLQTRLAGSSSELMQRVGADTARFESLIGETAERSSTRLAAAVKDLPAALAQRMDTEIAKIEGALKGSVLSLSDQMRQVVDGVPTRLAAMTHDTLQSLDANLERSFSDVSQRAEWLNEKFRRNATETTEAVLQGYVDFIYLAVDRFRRELDEVNAGFTRDLEARLRPPPGPAGDPQG